MQAGIYQIVTVGEVAFKRNRDRQRALFVENIDTKARDWVYAPHENGYYKFCFMDANSHIKIKDDGSIVRVRRRQA